MLLGIVLPWLSIAQAAAPPLVAEPRGGAVTVPRPDLPALDTTLVLPWSSVGFRAAAPESAPVGPDLVALGPDGAWAVWDPVRHVVLGAGFSLAVPHADSLAYTEEGDLLVLDDGARTLARYTLPAGALAARVPLSGLSPVGATLDREGELAVGRDVFGNLHPLADLSAGGLDAATGPHLLPPAHQARLQAGRVTVDGAALGPVAAVGARVVGDWVVIEGGARGAVTTRTAISLVTGREVGLPARAGARYRPSVDVAAGPDGDLVYLEPAADGLHLIRVSP